MSKEYQRFLDSMNMDYAKWHDGIGYDLDVLRKLSTDEKEKGVILTLLRKLVQKKPCPP